MAAAEHAPTTNNQPAKISNGKGFTTDRVETTRSRAELATAYTEMERNLTFFQTMKIYWRSCLCCAYAMLIILNFGIDGIIAGATISVPKFCEDYGTQAGEINSYPIWVIPAVWISIFGAVGQATSVIGALICGYITDRIGRRYANVLSCLISFGGVAAQYWSHGSLGVLVAGKGINGVAIGMWLVLAPTYVSEVAPLRIRGVLSAMVNTVIFSGVFLFTGVMYVLAARTDTSSYLIPFACQWIIPCLVLLTFWLWPESPVWLVRVGRREKAIKAIEQIHGKDSHIDKEGLLAQIEETLAQELAMKQSGEESFGFAECFNKSNRMRTFATVFVYTCQYLSANTLVIGYQTYYYRLVVGWGPSKAFAVTLGSTGFYWACNMIAWCFVAKLRRRPLIVYGQVGAAICLFIMGGMSEVGNMNGYYGVVVFMYIWGFFYETSIATVGLVIGAELPALRMRARTQALANACLQAMSWVQAFIFPYMFNPDAGNLGGKIAFYFAATTTVGAIGTFFLLPETLGRTPAEIGRMFEMGVPVRNFHKTKFDDECEPGQNKTQERNE